MPGTWIEWKNGVVRTDTYWKIPEPKPGKLSLDAASEELDELLQES